MAKECFYKLECETDPTQHGWRDNTKRAHGYRFEPYQGIYTSSPITSTHCMFEGAYLIKLDASEWDLGSVTDMSYMFYGAEILKGVRFTDTSNVTNMSSMFYDAASLTSVSLPDTGNVTNMSSMFVGATGLTSVSLPDTGNVTNMRYMFWNANNFDQDIRNWDVSSVTDFTNMFRGWSNAMQEKFGVGDTPTREWFNKGD